MQPVRRDLAEHEEVPWLLGGQLAPDQTDVRSSGRPARARCRAGATEVRDVEDVVVVLPSSPTISVSSSARNAHDLAEGGSGTAHRQPGNAWEEGTTAEPRSATNAGPGTERVPDGLRIIGRRMGQTVVARVLAVAESVDAELTCRLARHGAGPGRDGDGGVMLARSPTSRAASARGYWVSRLRSRGTGAGAFRSPAR